MNRRNIFILLIFLVFVFFLITNSALFNPIHISNRTSFDDQEILIKTLEVEKSETIEEMEEIEAIEEKTSTLSLLAVGDIMFHMPQIKSAYILEDGTYDFKDVFKYVKKYIESADISIANLETVVAGNDKGFFGYPTFNSPQETLEAIKYAGFDILVTANNHALDQGKEGLLNTIDFIEKEGMKNIGTNKKPDNQILIERINDIEVALLAYSYGFNGLDYTLTEEEFSYMVNRIDEDRIKEDILKAKDMGSDVIVAYIHWGNEYEREPSDFQLELGRKMVEWGANIILGSHPHVIQRSEIIEYDGRDNFIIYSMGNFLSNQREENINTKYVEDGVMVKIQIEKDFVKDETHIKEITYVPTWVRRYNDRKMKYEIIPIEDFLQDEALYSTIYEKERKRIEESYHSTLEIMAQN